MKTALQEPYTQMATEELFREYQQTHDAAIKWEIALRYAGLIKSIALQLRGVYCGFAQLDDIINEGVIVLADAVDKYDLSRGKFDTYVAKRIRGMIIDLARQQDWVPRTIRKRAKDIERATSELYTSLGRCPTENEIIQHMGITREDYQEAMAQASTYSIISLEQLFERYDQWPRPTDGEGDLHNTPEQALQSEEMLAMLTKAVSSLRRNEQLVLALYYQKDLKMKDIAEVLGVSAPRVSQIHAKALQKLKILLEQYISGN